MLGLCVYVYVRVRVSPLVLLYLLLLNPLGRSLFLVVLLPVRADATAQLRAILNKRDLLHPC
jgi:hypothetical protein